MLCQKCHKNLSTVRYAEVVDGQVTDRHLCAECLSSHQETAGVGFELSGPVPTGPRAAPAAVVQEAVRTQRACSTCGTLLSEIFDAHRVGCARCYESFGGQIESILEGLHRALGHKGKAFRVDDTRARVRSDLETKRALLRSVLEAENYEEAASLRDEIRYLEEGLYAFESGVD